MGRMSLELESIAHSLVGGRGVLARIDGARRYASPAFGRLGDLLSREPEACLQRSSRQLAAAAAVSEATVIRFCQWLGFGGLPELKAGLAVDLLLPYSTYDRIEPGDDARTVARKFYDVTMHSMQKTLSLIDMDELERVVEVLNVARRVECYGAGGLSGPMSAMLAYRLLNLQIPATAVYETHLMPSSASLLDAEDVALGISFSGMAVPVAVALEAARARRSTTIAVTNYINSPVTQYADHCLYTAALRDAPIFGEAISSRLSQLAVLEIVYAHLAMQRLPRGEGLHHA